MAPEGRCHGILPITFPHRRIRAGGVRARPALGAQPQNRPGSRERGRTIGAGQKEARADPGDPPTEGQGMTRPTARALATAHRTIRARTDCTRGGPWWKTPRAP